MKKAGGDKIEFNLGKNFSFSNWFLRCFEIGRQARLGDKQGWEIHKVGKLTRLEN